MKFLITTLTLFFLSTYAQAQDQAVIDRAISQMETLLQLDSLSERLEEKEFFKYPVAKKYRLSNGLSRSIYLFKILGSVGDFEMKADKVRKLIEITSQIIAVDNNPETELFLKQLDKIKFVREGAKLNLIIYGKRGRDIVIKGNRMVAEGVYLKESRIKHKAKIVLQEVNNSSMERKLVDFIEEGQLLSLLFGDVPPISSAVKRSISPYVIAGPRFKPIRILFPNSGLYSVLKKGIMPAQNIYMREGYTLSGLRTRAGSELPQISFEAGLKYLLSVRLVPEL